MRRGYTRGVTKTDLQKAHYMNLHSYSQKNRPNPYHVLSDIIFRWSPRSMTGENMSAEELMPLFEAARYAPSEYNSQPERFFYASRETKSFDELFTILAPGNQKWCEKASFLLVLASKKTFEHNGKVSRTHAFGTGASFEAFAIEGTRRNLVVHAMSGFDYDKARSFLHLSDDFEIICMVAVGKPAETVAEETVSDRQPIEKIAIAI